ncbi:cyclic GMP-AMP synthase-like receptor 3 isoform X1 [Acropora palmata]|uniref:cyclic GMP-AMP synthase-like receptor 3 isoform X1 n=2 Tax=Acropora palmata TaxID=6131 RepID=UPI003DA03588
MCYQAKGNLRLTDIMALSRPNSSRANSLTKKLRDFSVKYVKISEADMSRSKDLVRDYIENEVMDWCKRNSSLPILRLEYTGSVYEGLKTEAADEVDVMAVLRTNRQEITVEPTPFPGYARLKVGPNSGFRRYANSEGYIEPTRLRDAWFYSLVTQAVTTFNSKLPSPDVRLVARYHGPAVQIDIYSKISDKVLLSTDLVPCFHLPSDEYYVAKPYSVSQADLLWRQSFSLKEKAKLQHMDRDGGCRHELLRIVKTLVKKQRTSLGKLESYHLKTAFMHYMDDEPYSWNGQDSLGEHFRGFLQKVQGYLETATLPHYWLSGVNLIEDIDQRVLAAMAGRIRHILNSDIVLNAVLA